MNGADILLKSLLKEKTKVIFGYPGGAAIPLYDKLKDYPIKHVLPRNEQGAAMAADAYYRVTGRPGVCVSTSGPGATNLVTGIANAYLDSVGMVAITCQVASSMVGTDAFQEIDITGVTHSITKHNYFVESIEDLPRIIKEAFFIASTGRPGPVHIDIPVDIFKTEVKDFIYPTKVDLPGYHPLERIATESIDEAVKLIEEAKRPIVLSGHGVVIAKAEKELKTFIEKNNIPLINTLLGIGAIPEDHPLHFGMLGMHGMAWANYAVHNADLIIGIGLRFDDRITGRIGDFAKKAKVIHVDIDKAEIGKNTIVDVPILGDAREALKIFNQRSTKKSHEDWIKKIKKWQKENELKDLKKHARADKTEHLMAHDIIGEIHKQTKGKAVMVADVGQNQMWTAHYYNYSQANQLLNSGGLGCMGYSLPASIGAKFGNPKSDVWALMGDGGLQMNIQELGTIKQEKLPIKIIVFNNGYLGMVRQWQELFYQRNYAHTKLDNPDFCAIARAYGIEAHRVDNWDDAKEKIKLAHNSKSSIFIEFIIGPEDNVYPMVPPGNALGETIIKR